MARFFFANLNQPCGLKYAKVRKMYQEQCSTRIDGSPEANQYIKAGYMD